VRFPIFLTQSGRSLPRLEIDAQPSGRDRGVGRDQWCDLGDRVGLEEEEPAQRAVRVEDWTDPTSQPSW
jgi:hypothetical protein